MIYLSKYRRFCDSRDDKLKMYKVETFAQEVNFVYNVDISGDDPNCQSSRCCQACYRNLKKVNEKIKHEEKPYFGESVRVHYASLQRKC